MAQLFGVLMLVMPAAHPAAEPVPSVVVTSVLPAAAHHDALPAGAGLTQLVAVVYFTESAKYASSAVTRRSEERRVGKECRFSLALEQLGIAMVARMKMITMTIRSSMRWKPLRLL